MRRRWSYPPSMALFRKRDRNVLPVVPDAREYFEFFAVAHEIAALRNWLDPKVYQWPSGVPWVWIWTNPIFGLNVTQVQGAWYATAMGFNEHQLPQPLGITPRPVCPIGTPAADVAYEIVTRDVIHSLSTYVTAPEHEVLPYGMAWASNELFEFAQAGLVSDPFDE